MSTPDGPARWRKSTRSQSQTNECVEVALDAGRARVRDTKNREAGLITVPLPSWHAFLRHITAEAQ